MIRVFISTCLEIPDFRETIILLQMLPVDSLPEIILKLFDKTLWHFEIVISSYFKWGVHRVRMCYPGLIILLILASFSNALNFYDDCGINKARPMLEKTLSLFKTLNHLSYLRPFPLLSTNHNTEDHSKLNTVMSLVERCVEGLHIMKLLSQLKFFKNSAVICKIPTGKIPNK